MTPEFRKQILKVVQKILPSEEYNKLQSITIEDMGFGYDKFGLEKESVFLAYAFMSLLHRYYFRVDSFGLGNVPTQGRIILASNHSGVMPFDAGMIGTDLAKKMDTPRMTRTIMDLTANNMPFTGVALRRVGQVVGTRKNFEELMKMEEMVLVFPEGAKGSGKMFWERYQLKSFNVGHIEFALKYKAPIIPIAVIGGEEQMPNLYNIKPLADALQISMVPITLNLLLFGPLGMMMPFPTKYRIYYGEPLHFYQDYPEEALNDPELVKQLAQKVQGHVQEMVDQGLADRKNIFF